MRTYHGLADFKPLAHAVVTSGTFDGVHIGHQKILQRLREIADRTPGGQTVLLTYWPHPRLVLHPDDDSLRLLSTIEEKAGRLAQHGVDHLLILPFTPEFSRTSSEEFIRRILVEQIGTRTLVIGYDHRFGRNREGSFAHLRTHATQYGFTVEEIPRQDIDDVGVSSTKIRQALAAGEVTKAHEYLGHPYQLRGQVVRGNQLGRQIGFPTANLEIAERYKLIPADGIYAVRVSHQDRNYNGMLYIGRRPVLDVSDRTIEVNIFDFAADLYGQTLTVELVALIRFEEKFASLDALRIQLGHDETAARRLLQGN